MMTNNEKQQEQAYIDGYLEKCDEVNTLREKCHALDEALRGERRENRRKDIEEIKAHLAQFMADNQPESG